MRAALADVIAAALLLALTSYSVAGGVDFGAGVWDLLAGGAERGRRPRQLIDRAMAPVWEVNNVWLVFAMVVTWTGFPTLFEATFLSLYPLFSLALLGLILRGAFFAFRHAASTKRERRTADLLFGISSLLTPFFFAATLGAIASGQVGLHGPRHSVLEACFNPMSISFGLVSVAATAFSGASFLVGDARRYGLDDLVMYFSRRLLAATAALILLGTLALAATAAQSGELLRSMLTGRGLPFALLAMVLTPMVALLIGRRVYAWYRTLTIGAVAGLVLTWGFAQAPYLLPGQLTISQAAAPEATQVLLVVVALVLHPGNGSTTVDLLQDGLD